VIRNFAAGLRVANATDLAVKGVEFAENTDGVDLQQGSYRSTIRQNAFKGNRSRGIMLRSDVVDNIVKENTFTGNRVGILLFGAVDTSVMDNVVSDSMLAGIRVNVLATSNLVRGNHVSSNPAGIEFPISPTGSAVGNTISANTIATNVCGIKGPVEGNQIRRSLFVENGEDSCD
jgi:parallel beta-helix repeat protein